MLLRANVLATGYSGIREQTLDLLLQMLNRDVLPVVPSRARSGPAAISRRWRTWRWC